MIEKIKFLAINGNQIDEPCVAQSLEELQEKLNELIDVVNNKNVVCTLCNGTGSYISDATGDDPERIICRHAVKT